MEEDEPIEDPIEEPILLAGAEPVSNRGPGCLVLPALLLIAYGVYLGWQELDLAPEHEREYEHWVQMCANENGEATCREFGSQRMAYCYHASGGKQVGPHVIPERQVETLYRGEFSKNRYYRCLDLAVDYGLAFRRR